jgi:hypothetical protein
MDERARAAGARGRRTAGTPWTAGLALLAGLVGLPATTGAAAAAAPAAAQACPQSTHDRDEPGQEVTLVGYTAGCLATAGEPGGPPITVSGYLHTDACADIDLAYCTPADGPTDPTSGLPVGRFALDSATDAARGQRMELAFTLPAGLATGLYYLVVCEDPCASRPSGQLAATPLYVGVDPPPDGRPVRRWPLDDPAIAELSDDALVQTGDGPALTGAEARAARGIVAGEPEPEAAAERSAEPGEPWRPPAWSLTATLVVALVVLAAWRRRGPAPTPGSGRKQVRRVPPPAASSLTSSALEHVASDHAHHPTDHLRRVRPAGLEDRARRHRRARGQVVEGRRDR